MTGDSIQTGDIQGVGIAIGSGASVTIYGDVHYYPIVLRAPLREVFDTLIKDHVRLFGGRADVLDRIMRRIQEPSGGYTVITAPAGFGKTALLATLVHRTPAAFAYHFFTALYDAGGLSETFFLRNIVQQMAAWHDHTEQVPTDLNELRALYQRFLDTPIDRTRVLVLDGLDEVTGWRLAPYLNRGLPERLHFILSVRELRQDWREEYDLPVDQVTHLPLAGLGRDEVAQVFRAAGARGSLFADTPELINEIMRLAAYDDASPTADPLYVRLLAEDAENGNLTSENISTQPKGLEPYLNDWWQDLKQRAGELPARDLFGTLAAALGPIGRAELEAINSSLTDEWAGDFFEDVLRQVQRFVVGDAQQGYALFHPRLRHYLNDPQRIRTIADYRERLLIYCAHWREHRSRYALQHYANHLLDAIRTHSTRNQAPTLYMLALNEDYLREQTKAFLNEPDLPLRTLRAALLGAAEVNDATAMAKLLFAQGRWWLDEIRQASPLDALRAGNLERAWELADLFDAEYQTLWYLLLAWELEDTGKLEGVQATRQRLQAKSLPQLSGWAKQYAGYIRTAQAAGDASPIEQVESSTASHSRLTTAHVLADSRYYAPPSMDIAIQDDESGVVALTAVAVAQAQVGEQEPARETFAAAIRTAQAARSDDKLFLHIVTTQIQVHDFVAAIQTTELITDERSRVIALSAIAAAQAHARVRETARETFAAAIRAAKAVRGTPWERAWALLHIINSQIQVGDFAAACETARLLEYDVEDALSAIAVAQALAGEWDAMRQTFAATIQMAKSRTSDIYGYNLFLAIVRFQIKAGDFAGAAQTARMTDQFWPGWGKSALKDIAQAQAQAGERNAARATFAAALQMAPPIKNNEYRSNALRDIVAALARSGKLAASFEAAKVIAHKETQAAAFRDIAEAQVQMGEFSAALQTAQNCADEQGRVQVLRMIAALQAKGRQFVDALQTAESIEQNSVLRTQAFLVITVQARTIDPEIEHRAFAAALQSADKTGWQGFERWAVLRDIARVQAQGGAFEAALQTTQKIFYSGRASMYLKGATEVYRADALHDIACAQAQEGQFATAIETTRKIEFGSGRAKALAAIAAIQIQIGEHEAARQTFALARQSAQGAGGFPSVTGLLAIASVQAQVGERDAAQATFATALEVAQTIDQDSRSAALCNIAEVQAHVGFGERAVYTAKLILDGHDQQQRDERLPEIAAALVQVGDQANFKQLLVLCPFNIGAAYKMCGLLAQLYLDQAEAVASVIIGYDSVTGVAS